LSGSFQLINLVSGISLYLIFQPMKTNQVYSSGHLVVSKASLILFFLIFSTTLMSQSQVNFSGKWIYDKTKSTTGTNSWEYPGTISREITQTVSTRPDTHLNFRLPVFCWVFIIVQPQSRSGMNSSPNNHCFG